MEHEHCFQMAKFMVHKGRPLHTNKADIKPKQRLQRNIVAQSLALNYVNSKSHVIRLQSLVPHINWRIGMHKIAKLCW